SVSRRAMRGSTPSTWRACDRSISCVRPSIGFVRSPQGTTGILHPRAFAPSCLYQAKRTHWVTGLPDGATGLLLPGRAQRTQGWMFALRSNPPLTRANVYGEAAFTTVSMCSSHTGASDQELRARCDWLR